jgi:hypothetical protein
MIARWKARKATDEEAPAARTAAEALTGPDPRTGFRYVYAGGLSAEASDLGVLVLRDALEPRGVLLNVAQVHPPSGQPWTLRCGSARRPSLPAPD